VGWGQPDEQQVVLVRQEAYGELHDEEPEDERLDEDDVDLVVSRPPFTKLRMSAA
jgi:hypothetical protein